MLNAGRTRWCVSTAAVAALACDGASIESEPAWQGAIAEAREEPASLVDAGPREDAGAQSATSRSDASSGSCTLPPDCERAESPIFSLEPCCTERIACGFSRTMVPPELQDLQETIATAVGLHDGDTCAPRDRFFIKHPGSEDLRIQTQSGDEILLSTGCETASILSISFIGCCMPNNRCGVSTYGIWDTLAVIAPGEPFSRLQCVPSSELNAQIGRTKLRGLRFLPDTDAPCDYAALDASLPPADPYVW